MANTSLVNHLLFNKSFTRCGSFQVQLLYFGLPVSLYTAASDNIRLTSVQGTLRNTNRAVSSTLFKGGGWREVKPMLKKGCKFLRVYWHKIATKRLFRGGIV